MSNGCEPGRDDGGLPPVNIVIPDDARELDRDMLAYRREQRAERLRARLRLLAWPFRKLGLRGPAAIMPLIATCVAVSMLAGVMLSLVTISPASAPTVPPSPAASAPRSAEPSGTSLLPATTPLSSLPAGTIRVGGKTVPVRGLVSSVLALVPANCSCGPALRRLAGQGATARVPVYFVGTGTANAQIPALTARYGNGTAISAYDTAGVLSGPFQPDGLTVLLVYADATAQVERGLTPSFQFGPALSRLAETGRSATG